VVSENVDPTQDTPVAETEEQVAPIQSTERPTWEPDEAYKGLQRELQKEKDRSDRLERKLDDMSRQPPVQGGNPLEIQAHNYANQVYNQYLQQGVEEPQARQAYQMSYQSALTTLKLQQFEAERAAEQRQRSLEDLNDKMKGEMREMARIAGVDPDSPDLNYGDRRDEDVTAKMRVFRQSLREVRGATIAEAPVPSQRPPDRSAARVERQEPSGTPGKPDADAALRAFEKQASDLNTGAIPANKGAYAELRRLKEVAREAGAVF